MNYQNEDTIAAAATPGGVGALSIIRISGKDTFPIVYSIFEGKTDITQAHSHTIHYGNIIDGEDIVDDVLLLLFRSPNSYTGEDVIEISTHGNPLITTKILKLLFKSGIRPAEAGEFTKRAFLNNRMDLSQAEAVVDVISSNTDASLRGARSQLTGAVSQKVQQLRDDLVNASSLIELELDFAEEDVEFIQAEELSRRLMAISAEIEKMLSSYSVGKIIKEGINTVIVGMPNVGKSSLLNCILKESRAIVSSIPGTTRDIIKEELSINGIYYKFYDTAGIRISGDEIEVEGMNRALRIIDEADLILLLFDKTNPHSFNLPEKLNNLLKNKKHIIKIVNKSDIPGKIEQNIKDYLFISALKDEGIDELVAKMEEMMLNSSNYTEKSLLVTNERHYNCLLNAKEHLVSADCSLKQGFTGEFISVDLRNASISLSEIIGEVTSDDVLNNIFSKFCIGK
ncbi:MAG TPA: tRNA uridine-5-carboxymethylaminomethyl(34) synthesis GTPase MnmE [Ignavibacteriaceae bacterium]|nr:tRNA uridine-5-carboxymethylaminomethyl(34) synthesis GTPase MnmE [Ignavibacteriaceae bacterium]